MHPLFEEAPGKRVLLLGNEGIVRGALESGVEVATAYPGTPASEIADTFFVLAGSSSLYFEYSANEKVALEVAAGAAIAGMRSMCSMKHVGLNVAADPLNTLSYTGVKAGMVIVTADDPSMHSSQNEQDNRFYAKLSLLPMLEPSSPSEAMELTRRAFALSEELELPVLLRTTTRVNHTRGVCVLGPLVSRRFLGHFHKEPMRWVPVPAVAYKLRAVLLEKIERAAALLDKLGLDRIEGRGDVGIITSGIAYAYTREVLRELGAEDRVRVLKIAAIHPLPRRAIEEFLGSVSKALVIEELEPYLEQEVRAIAQEMGAGVEIHGKGKGFIPRAYELNPDIIRPVVGRLLGVPVSPASSAAVPDLPPRPPLLCAGCTHRTTYYAVKSIAEKDTYYPSDIGCYTLGLAPPLSVTDSFLCMGSSVTMASGVSIHNSQRHVAFIGDSTFFHSGLTGLVNAVHNGHDLMLVILDNSTTAMTGHQPHPGQASRDGKTSALDMEALVRSLGVSDVHVMDPENLKGMIAVLEGAYRRKGVRVIISKHPCPLYASRVLKDRRQSVVYRVDHDKCKFCGKNLSRDACGISILAEDEILRAKTKIMLSDALPSEFPPRGQARKPQSAPCTLACPANVCAFGYMSNVRAGKFKEALALIREQAPLPLALGRVCHHPCESFCVRAGYDEPIAINDVKRFLAEQETDDERRAYFDAVAARAVEARKRTGGKKVAVVGAGPAGLTAAFELTVRGYGATVFEREDVAGGLLATCIPAYRMPRDLLRKELDAILSVGIELKTGKALSRDFSIGDLLSEGYEAVCLAVGAHRGRRMAIPGEDSDGVEDALHFLRRIHLQGERSMGKRVIVVGGGDAAIDAARTAVRLGAEEVSVLYRRSREEMPAAEAEVTAAVAEGVRIVHQVIPVEVVAVGGRVTAVECVKTLLGEPDKSGRRQPIALKGSEHRVDADSVIIAIGQYTDPSVFEAVGRPAEAGSTSISVDPRTGATSAPRVFAAGDATGTAWTVIAAIAEGKRAAYGIDKMLSGGVAVEPFELHRIEEIDLNLCYHPPDVKQELRARPLERKPADCAGDFGAISIGFDRGKALGEAARCLSCGQCARCNNCIDNFGCPAIYKKDGAVQIDETLCIGCGVCAQICPNDAIVPVSIASGK